MLVAGSVAALGSAAQVPLTPPPAPNSVLVVAVGTYPGGMATVVDTSGNSYSNILGVTTPAGATLGLYLAVNAVTTNPFVVTAASGGVTEVTFAVHAYSGVNGLAGVAAFTAQVGTSQTPTSGPLAVNMPGALAFGVVSHDAAVTTGAGSGFVLRTVPTEDPAMVPLATEDRIEASPGTTAATFALSGSSGWGCALIVLNPGP